MTMLGLLLLLGTAVAEPWLTPLRPDSAPELTEKVQVKMTTDAGELMLEIYPQAAPGASRRFLELVDSGFYDNTPIFRVVKRPRPFVAQFGINWRPPHKEYKERNFDDDPTLFRLERGTLCFAKAGLDTNTCQVFINYRNNTSLTEPKYNFAAFGKVVEGMDVADSWPSVGDDTAGLEQGRLWRDGDSYLKSLPQKPATIVKMERWPPVESDPPSEDDDPPEMEDDDFEPVE